MKNHGRSLLVIVIGAFGLTSVLAQQAGTHDAASSIVGSAREITLDRDVLSRSYDSSVIELLKMYGDESAQRAKALEGGHQVDRSFFGISIEDSIAGAALAVTIFFALIQLRSARKVEANTLTLEIWQEYLDRYSSIGNCINFLNSPSSISYANFGKIQETRNWLDGLAMLGMGKPLINNCMLRRFGIEVTFRAFMRAMLTARCQLKYANAQVRHSREGLLESLDRELSKSQKIYEWLDVIEDKRRD